MKHAACSILTALLLAPGASAQGLVFSVAPEASTVAFSLGATMHTVQGTFHVQQGSVRFEPGAPGLSGSIVVAAASGRSGNGIRDRKMTSKILEEARFPDISFAPARYQGALAASGDSEILVTGVFTLLGNAHDLTVPMQIHIEGTGLTAKARFTVPYVQWGVKDPSLLVVRVAKEVEIRLSLQGTLAPAD